MTTLSYPTFNNFNDLVQKYGISSSNMYDIYFGQIGGTSDSPLWRNINEYRYSFDFSTQSKITDTLRLYADELSLPGEQIVTNNYKINNSPAYSYATDIVYPEMNITFILDAFMNQKKLFEKWIEFIKPMSVDSGVRMMRLRYRDSYVSNITINKYERYSNGGLGVKSKIPIIVNPATKSTVFDNILKYSVVLQNAYPTSISSIQLNSGSSQLNRVNIGFKYEYLIPTSTNGNGVTAILENVSTL